MAPQICFGRLGYVIPAQALLVIALFITLLCSTCNKANKPVAAFSFQPASCAAPCEIQFINESEDAVAYRWDFGDSATTVDENPKHTYSQPGNYEVKLTAISPDGESQAKKEIIILNPSQVAPPIANFTISNNNCIAPCQVSFTNTSTNAETYSWKFGDEGHSEEKNPSHTYQNPGNYTVELTVTSSSGQTAMASKPVSIQEEAQNDPPIAAFSFTNNYCEAPCTISFTNESQNATSYSWNFGDGSTSMSANPSHSYQVPGQYTVRLTASAPGEMDNSTSKVVTIEEGEPTYSTAKILYVESYGLPFLPPSFCFWDFCDGPDVYNAFYDGSIFPQSLISSIYVDINEFSFPIRWNCNPPCEIPSKTKIYWIYFYDDDPGFAPAFMGSSYGFRIQDFIDNENFPATLDLSNADEGIYVRIRLQWE